MTRLTSPIPSAQAFVWSRFWTNAITSPTRPFASVEKPNSLGSWPMKIDDREAGQVAGPDRVRQEVGHEPEPGQAGSDRDRSDEQGEHPGERDRLGLVARRQGQDRRRDHRPER